MRTEILGVGFDDLTPEEAARRGQALVETEGFHYAVTPNPEFLLAAKKDGPGRESGSICWGPSPAWPSWPPPI